MFAYRYRYRAPALAGVSALALSAFLGAAPAQAQEDGAPQEDKIIVTGSRIPRTELEAISPVTVIGAADLANSGEISLTDVLKDVGALVGTLDSTNSTNLGIGTTGLNLLNLRNLGTNRTLVLVNGRRHVGGTGSSTAVDINAISMDMVERVEVLTGGASAVYGADAVTGAVNFILKDDFDGLTANFQYGRTGLGDGDRLRMSAMGGKNFAGGRGNITASFEYSSERGIAASRRDFASEDFAALLDNPNFQPDPNLPGFDNRLQILFKDARIRFASPEGAVAIDFFDGFDLLFNFEGDGDPYDPGEVISFRNSIGGSATRISDLIGDLLPDIDRRVFNLNTHYDFTPSVRGFIEFKLADVNSFADGNPAFTDLIPIVVADNPFIPDPIRDAAIGAGADFVFMSHDTIGLGLRGEDINRRTWRVAGGFEGQIFADTFDNLNYELSYVYGRTDEDIVAVNNLILDRFYAAMDVVIDPNTGEPTCRSNLDPTALPPQIPFPGGFGFLGWFDAFNTEVTPDNYGTTPFFTPGPGSGCVPLNMFGLAGPSQEAIDWVNDDSLREATIEQHVATLAVSGDTSGIFSLPAGPVAFALGGEYRKEKSVDVPALIDRIGLTFGNQIFPTTGDYDVKEAFGEISIPLLADLSFAQDLTVEAAYRYSSYSTIGTTHTWRAGGRWSPMADVRVRGVYARTVRAPNIGELFGSQSEAFFLPDDPCDVDNIPLAPDPGLRAANCAAILTPLGVDPTTFEGDDILNATFPGVLGGNPELEEETADTWTVGVVLQPGFAPDLTVTVDYFNISMANGIIFPSDQDIVNQCVDLPSINNPFCPLIGRRADGGLSFLEVVPVNVAFFETSGIDFELGYSLDPAEEGWTKSDIGRFAARLRGSWLEKLNVVSLPGQEPDDEKNEVATLLGDDAPEIVLTLDFTWTLRNLSVNYQWTYHDPILRDEIAEFEAAEAQGAVLQDPAFTSALNTHDLNVRYRIDDVAEVYVGVNNLTNQEPDPGFIRTDASATPIGPLGRFFYTGVRFTLQ